MDENEVRMLAVTRDAFDIEGMSDEGVQEVMACLDDVLGIAEEIAYVLYNPFDGLLPATGMTPFEAINAVLIDLGASAPTFPDWAHEYGDTLYFACDLFVQAVGYALVALGWGDPWAAETDAEYDAIIASAKDFIATLVSLGGAGAPTPDPAN